MNRQEEELPPLLQIKYDSDYFKALLAERIEEIRSNEKYEDRSEARKSAESSYCIVDTSNQPTNYQDDHNRPPGCQYSALSPLIYNAVPHATPIQVISLDQVGHKWTTIHKILPRIECPRMKILAIKLTGATEQRSTPLPPTQRAEGYEGGKG